jgi:YbbR domain-containing protein
MLRWLRDNLGSLILAFVMSLMVWASAVNAADPSQESVFPEPIPIHVVGLAEDLVVVGTYTGEAQVSLRAPRSVWDQLTAQDIHVEADLADLGAGIHRVDLNWRIDIGPAHVLSLDPRSLELRLEAVASQSVPVQVRALGSPAVGYRVETPQANPDEATVTGAASAVARVAQILAEVNLTGRRDDIEEIVTPIPVDSSGQTVEGVRVTPETVHVVAVVEQLGGFRDVAVKVIIDGQVAAGYWVTRITVSPPIVTVYSADAEAVVTLPGFVETEALVLTDARADIVRRLTLDLPEGITPVGDLTVLVEVDVAAIESSLTLTRPLEIQGLAPGLYALPSPDSVSVILSGSLPVLEDLSFNDVRVILDLLNLGVGTHQVTPQVVVLPSGIQTQAVLPSTIEVTITTRPLSTPTPSP